MKYISRSLATVVVASFFAGATVAHAEGSSSSPEIPPGLAGIIGIGVPSPQGIIGIGTQGIIGIGVQGIIGIGEPGVQGIIGIGTQGIIGIGVDGSEQTLGIIGIGDGAETLGIIGIGVDGSEQTLGIIGIGGEQTFGIIGIGGETAGDAETLGIIGIGEEAGTEGIIGIGTEGIIGIGTEGIIGIGEESSIEGIIGIGDPVIEETETTLGIIGIGFQQADATHLTLGVSASDTALVVAGTKYNTGGPVTPRGTPVLLFGDRDALGLNGNAWVAVPFAVCAGDPALMSVLAADATVSADLWLPAGADSAQVCGIAFDFGGDTTPAAGLYRVEGTRAGAAVSVGGIYRIH
ncbi:MAG: hypothetical protein LC632_07540 [Xanthomonadaceae bacterium]|nr:hypothetical protein [Xanthomonadaceae bacterium]